MSASSSFRVALVASVFTVGLGACGSGAEDTPDFSEAYALVEILASDEFEGRAVETEGNAKARELLITKLGELEIEPLLEAGYESPFVFGGFSGNTETGEPARPARNGINLLGKIEGTSDSDLIMVVSAHFDHVGIIDGEIHNGADDNASGTAGLIEIARHFKKYPPVHDVVIALFDAEEAGLSGARAFVADMPIDAEKVAVNLNFDMLSRGDNGQLWAAGSHHTPALSPIIDKVADTAPVELHQGYDGRDPEQGQDWTLQSDHAAFHRAGIPFVYLGVEDHPDYHKPGDDYEKINLEWFGNSIATAVAVAEALDDNLELIAAATAVEEEAVEE